MSMVRVGTPCVCRRLTDIEAHLRRAVTLLFLGSFGENPEVRIQNSGEGGAGLARVLSDGGWVGTGL